MLKEVSTSNAPIASGPYSQAIDTGGLVFGSGQLGADPTSGDMHSHPLNERWLRFSDEGSPD
jgi:2-iminobutanoate/2-iminopropanoate deaminase